jgi:hypothetical protein
VLERACPEKTRRGWPNIKAHVLAHGKKIGPVNTKQAGAIQTDIEACMGLWLTAMRMHKTEQYCHNTEISKQSFQEHSQCTLVHAER